MLISWCCQEDERRWLFRRWSPFQRSLLYHCVIAVPCTLSSNPHHNLYDSCPYTCLSSSAQEGSLWTPPGTRMPLPQTPTSSGSWEGCGVPAGDAPQTHSFPPQWASLFLQRALLLFCSCRSWSQFLKCSWFHCTTWRHSCAVFSLALHYGHGEGPFLVCFPCSPFSFHHHGAHGRDGHTRFPASKSSGSPRQTPCQKPLPLSVTVKFLKEEKSGSVIWSETN